MKLAQCGEIVSCPVCGSVDVMTRLVTRTFRVPGFDQAVDVRFSACARCSFIFQANPLDAPSLQLYYRMKGVPVDRTPTDIDLSVYEQQSDFIESVAALKGRRVLEVGPGAGWFLTYLASRRGALTSFEEHNEESVVQLLASGHSAHRSGDQFDAIVMCHVLEHIVMPVEALESLRLSLIAGGILFVEVPDWSFVDEHTDMLCLEHVNHFNAHNLAFALHSAGFAVLKVEVTRSEGYSTSSNRVVRIAARLLSRLSIDERLRSFDQGTQYRYSDGMSLLISRGQKGRLIGLYGASWIADIVISHTQNLQDVRIALFDQDKNKQLRGFMGHKVNPPEEIARLRPETVVILSSYEVEIRSYLKTIGYDGEVVSYREFEAA